MIIDFGFIGLMLFFSLKFKWKRKVVINIMSVLALTSELVKFFNRIREITNDAGVIIGGYIDAKALPLHLCSILIFIFFYLALTPRKENKALISFATAVSLIGGLLGVLVATSGTSFTDVSTYQSMLYHAAIVWFALHFIITKQVDLGLKAYIRNGIALFALLMIMTWINGALHEYNTNFFFTTYPPVDNIPFLTTKYGWYVYFVHLVFTGFVALGLLSLPYIIIEFRNKKKANLA